MIRILVVILVCLWVSFGSHAQTILVKNAESTINQMPRKGVSVKIELDRRTVEKQWLKLLRSWGKLDTYKSGGYQVNPAQISSISATPVVAFAGLEADNTGVTAFLAIDLGTSFIVEGSKEYEPMRKILQDFATELYREDINNQIAEADKAVDAAVRFHDKKMEQAADLARALEKNKADKAKLERQLKENIDQFGKLLTDSTQNKADQSATLEEINRLRNISAQKKNKLKDFQ